MNPCMFSRVAHIWVLVMFDFVDPANSGTTDNAVSSPTAMAGSTFSIAFDPLELLRNRIAAINAGNTTSDILSASSANIP